ncbi:VTT domain-containing protein [Roseateles sp.]|uniref:VTT domain-containing protein n=1 Tax=Roseateles sp. TaxID=1971397 RepID=UPI0039E15B9F
MQAEADLPLGRAIGDIYLGGGALARGYLGRPDLDREAFFPDPFVAGKRIYRTGDSGRLDGLGRLHFKGCNDRQIKLRGYRIEPGDIEAACRSLPGIGQAVVRKVELGGQSTLHAWLVGRQRDSDLLLAERLVGLLVPALFWSAGELDIVDLHARLQSPRPRSEPAGRRPRPDAGRAAVRHHAVADCSTRPLARFCLQLSERLGGRGVWTEITLRLLPLAPFAVANMVAGATHILLRDMLLETAIGISPSTLVMAFFMDNILRALH